MFDYHSYDKVPEKAIKQMESEGVDIQKYFDVKAKEEDEEEIEEPLDEDEYRSCVVEQDLKLKE